MKFIKEYNTFDDITIGRLLRKSPPEYKSEYIGIEFDKKNKTIGTIEAGERGDNIWSVFNVFVTEFYRDKGIGIMMYRTLIDKLREEGAVQLVSDTTLNSIHVGKIYKKLGGEFIGDRWVIDLTNT